MRVGVGNLQVALLDAFLGCYTFMAVLDTEELQQQAQSLVLLETGILVGVSLFGKLNQLKSVCVAATQLRTG